MKNNQHFFTESQARCVRLSASSISTRTIVFRYGGGGHINSPTRACRTWERSLVMGNVIQKVWAESIHVSIPHPMKSIHERDFDSKFWGGKFFIYLCGFGQFFFSTSIWGRCTHFEDHIFSKEVETTRRASLKILWQFLCPAKAPVVIYCLTSILASKTTICYLFCLADLTCGKMDG